MLRRLAIYAVLLVSNAVFAVVYTPASVPNPKDFGQANYVANPDAIVADSDVVWLNRCASMLEEQTRVELCVVALQSIGEAEAFDFAYELFQLWGIGKKGQNTGVLMLFVMDSHDIRLMTGTGIEGVLPDARCSQIIHDDMIPAFRDGDFGGGLCLGALRVYEICTDGEAPEELMNMSSVTNRGKYAEEDISDGELLLLVVGLVCACMFLVAFIIYLAAIKRCPKCHKLRAHVTREKVLLAATYSHEGKGERHYRCKNCGHEFDLPFAIPRRSSTVYVSGGGGFGGGSSSGGGSWGGGSTSGGGAGGKW